MAAMVGRGVRRQPQLGGVSQGSFHGEPRVRAVVAAHYPDACAHQLALGVHVVFVHRDDAGTRLPGAAEQVEQGGVSRGRWTEHRGQRAGVRRERPIREQLAPVDGQPQPMGGHSDRARTGLQRQPTCGVHFVRLGRGAHGAQLSRGVSHSLDQPPTLWLPIVWDGRLWGVHYGRHRGWGRTNRGRRWRRCPPDRLDRSLDLGRCGCGYPHSLGSPLAREVLIGLRRGGLRPPRGRRQVLALRWAAWACGGTDRWTDIENQSWTPLGITDCDCLTVADIDRRHAGAVDEDAVWAPIDGHPMGTGEPQHQIRASRLRRRGGARPVQRDVALAAAPDNHVAAGMKDVPNRSDPHGQRGGLESGSLGLHGRHLSSSDRLIRPS